MQYYKKNPRSKEVYRDIQIDLDMKVHKLIQDISIRWNSTFLMLDRILEDKEAVVLFLSSSKKLNVTISAVEWLKMANLAKLLRKFYEVTVR